MSLEAKLLSKTTVSTAVIGKTALYTGPDDYDFILSHAFFISAGDQGNSRISIGQFGATEDWLADRLLSDIDSANEVGLLMPRPIEPIGEEQRKRAISVQQLYSDGITIQFDCKTIEGVAGNTILLFGMLYE